MNNYYLQWHCYDSNETTKERADEDGDSKKDIDNNDTK